MSHIELLSSETINKIAAGEVIERPASVVKELLENAVDAGAGAVTVEIKDGGLSFIRVTDNGSGIARDEVPLAFERHATSKIRSELDLISISSLGFRGEALSSIAAVAKVEMITRRHEDLMGTRYVIEGGIQTVIEDVGAPEGTTIIIRDLFFNTPARRKFMKTPVTEGGFISSVVEKLALSHPEVSFRLLLNGRGSLHTSGNGKVKDIIYLTYGREAADALFEVSGTQEAGTGTQEADIGPEDAGTGGDMPLLRVGGYAAKPIFSRGNRSCEVFFINGRYVKSPLLTKALENAYNGFMMQHRYPFAVLYLEIDPAMIDVNVHPAKREIRFRQEDMVYHRLYEAVRRSLEGLELIPDVGFGQDGLKRKKAVSERPAEKPPEPFEKARREAGNELSTIELLQRSFRQEMEKEKRKEYAEAVSDRQASSHQQDDGKPTAGSGTAADGQAAGAVSSGIRLADSVGSTADRPAADAATFEARPTEGFVSAADGPAADAATFVARPTEGFGSSADEPAAGAATFVARPTEGFGSSADELTAGFLPAEDDATYGQGEASLGQAQQTEAASGKGEDSGVPDGADSFSGEGTLLRETAAEIYYKGLDDTGSGKNTQLSLDERLFTESSRKEFVLIGQLFGTYWLIQYRDKFMMIDQHAAHEKVLFEELMDAFSHKTVSSQQLLVPIILTLNDREIQAVERLTPQLTSMGYDIRPFGGREYAVYGIPYNLYSIAEEALLREMIDSLTEEEGAETGNLIYERIATMSCKAAVKGNTIISAREADELIDRLLKLEHPYTCPHGRPTMIVMSKNEIEKKFKRIVS